MKKIIILILLAFAINISNAQNDTLAIRFIGGTYSVKFNNVNVFSGIKNDFIFWVVGSDSTKVNWRFSNSTNFWQTSKSISVTNVSINGIFATNLTNIQQLISAFIPTFSGGGGGGGGGSYTFAGNIVNQSGNNIIINQVQPDWNALSGLGSIANKPNIPILDSTQFVKLRDSNKYNNGFITPSFFFANRGGGTKWSNFILGGYLVQKLNDSTYTINRDNTTIQDSIRINATIARFVGDSVKRDTSIANRVIDMSVDTNTNRLTIFKTNSNNKVLQLKINGGGGGGTATNYPLATMDSIGVIKTGKYIRNNTNYNFSQSNITTPTIKVDYLNGLFLRGSSYNGDANLWTSTDGVNWTSRASGVTNSRFLYYKGKYFAQRYTSVGNIYSSDGITWDNTNNNGGSAQIVNDTLFTFSYAVNQSAYSTDGITFTQIDPNMQGFGDDFVYNGKGVFVATNYASGQLTPKYFIRGGQWTQINGVDGGTVCRAAFYSTTKKMFILGHFATNNSYSYYSYDGINYNKCTGMGGDGSQIINIREINGVIFACGDAGIFYSYDGINFFKTNLYYIKPVSDITYNAGVLYSSNLDGTSISYSYDGIFWFTSNYSGIGAIESIAGNGSNRVVVGTSTGVFYNSSLKTDSTLIANITKGLFYDSLGNINIDSNYIKYLIRNNTSGGGGGGTTDTTSLSNRINAKLDVQRFSGDSTNKQNSINFLRLNKIDSVTINGDTTLLTFYRNGVSSYNIQLKRASGGVVGISTKWNNLSISGYQVQKINDSTYNINRDNTIIQDSIRINGKLDVARFTGDSIRWDTAIANRIITQRIDTNLNRIYYQKTNGKIDSLQLRLTANAGGASINNDSIVHPYPYPYKDTVNIISTTDKVVNLGTNNKALINFNESIKVTQLFTTQTNVNGNARNGKFIRYGNTFQTFAGNVLLSSADGSTFTQLTTSQIMSANNQYTTIEAMDLSGDSLIVLTSAGGGNYILCILGSLGNTILYRSASFTISDGSGSFVTDISKIQLLGTSLYAVNGASFNNYLIKINIVNLTSQTIATTGSPAAFFKSTTNLYFLDYSGWYYEINAPTTRILKISNNAVSDATLLENRYICVSDYIGNIYVADMTINKVVDYINDVYFGSSDISVYAFGNILYVFDGTATTLYVTASQFSFNNLIVNTLAPFMFNSSLLDSAGSSGSSGQSLLSQNGKPVWGTPTQQFPLQSILIWGSTASGAAQNPQLSFQSNNIGLSLSGTGVTLPAGTYQIILVAGMPAIDNSAPYPISFFKFGLSSTIDATFPTYNEIRGCINKASSPAGNTDVLNATFSITLTVTTSTIYYVTTYINRGTSAAMSGFVNIVRIK